MLTTLLLSSGWPQSTWFNDLICCHTHVASPYESHVISDPFNLNIANESCSKSAGTDRQDQNVPAAIK
jgi:hypothetical protein